MNQLYEIKATEVEIPMYEVLITGNFEDTYSSLARKQYNEEEFQTILPGLIFLTKLKDQRIPFAKFPDLLKSIKDDSLMDAILEAIDQISIPMIRYEVCRYIASIEVTKLDTDAKQYMVVLASDFE